MATEPAHARLPITHLSTESKVFFRGGGRTFTFFPPGPSFGSRPSAAGAAVGGRVEGPLLGPSPEFDGIGLSAKEEGGAAEEAEPSGPAVLQSGELGNFEA